MKTDALHTLGVHVLIDAGIPPDPTDKQQRRWCTCGLRSDHQVHQLPERTAEDVQTEARVMGETEDLE